MLFASCRMITASVAVAAAAMLAHTASGFNVGYASLRNPSLRPDRPASAAKRFVHKRHWNRHRQNQKWPRSATFLTTTTTSAEEYDTIADAGAPAWDEGVDAATTSRRSSSTRPAATYTQNRRSFGAAVPQMAKLAHSLPIEPFRPAWWARNAHIQTIVGGLFRSTCGYITDLLTNISSASSTHLQQFAWDRIETVDTPDGDFYQTNWKYAASGNHDDDATANNAFEVDADSDRPLVIISHGLESNAESFLVKDMTTAFNNVGMDAVCLSHRSCGKDINRTTKAYHLSFTDDLKHMVEQIASITPGRRIYLAGFSLGANVVTKYLAEMGEKAQTFNVCGAAVNAAPFDLTKVYVNLNEDGFSKSLYGSLILEKLIQKIENTHYLVPFQFTLDELRKCKTILDFEELVICPEFGFRDAMDYYEKSATHHLLDRIRVPQLIVQAMDDPFLMGNTNPPNDPSLPVRIHYTPHGGHCGYVLSENHASDGKTTWMPTQLARFLDHVDQNRGTR